MKEKFIEFLFSQIDGKIPRISDYVEPSDVHVVQHVEDLQEFVSTLHDLVAGLITP